MFVLGGVIMTIIPFTMDLMHEYTLCYSWVPNTRGVLINGGWESFQEIKKLILSLGDAVLPESINGRRS